MFTDAWQPRQALLDMSGLWPQWYTMEINIIIHILHPTYQETLMNFGAGAGVEPGGNGLESPVALFVCGCCLFVSFFVCSLLIWLAFL